MYGLPSQSQKNTKSGKWDIQILVKEIFSIIIKLSHIVEQFKNLVMPSDHMQFPKIGIDEVKLYVI